MNITLSEATVHYIAWFLDSYVEKHQTANHLNSLKEVRHLSNKLLETLEKPMSVGIVRHRLDHDK